MDTCTNDGNGGSVCSVTLTASAADAGWQFDHWSGDCSGTSATCRLTTSQTTCDYSVKPPCSTEYDDVAAVAHFIDTRAPTVDLNQAPGNNSVVYSDTRSEQFSWTTDEDGEAPQFACKRDAGSFGSCSSGVVWSPLADGIHDFCVHATDASGLTGGDTCTHWDQETLPTATIESQPEADTASTTAGFTYTSNKASHPADGSTLRRLGVRRLPRLRHLLHRTEGRAAQLRGRSGVHGGARRWCACQRCRAVHLDGRHDRPLSGDPQPELTGRVHRHERLRGGHLLVDRQ